MKHEVVKWLRNRSVHTTHGVEASVGLMTLALCQITTELAS